MFESGDTAGFGVRDINIAVADAVTVAFTVKGRVEQVESCIGTNFGNVVECEF